MKVGKRFLSFTLLLIALTACSRPEPLHREQMLIFGTLVDISLWGASEQQIQTASQAIQEDLNFMHEAWHPWLPGPTARTNQLLETGGRFSANPSVIPLVAEAKQLYRRSGGLFNPAIGRLVALWGFQSDDVPLGPPPSPEAIAELVKQNPNMDDIELDGIYMRGTNPAVRLDFGAFAKGYAVDRIIERLRELGINNAIINAGGDLRAIGKHGDRPWRIGIRQPRGEGVLASVEISGDESVFTSGDYERYYDYEGHRYHHIIDPRSGYPAQGVTSVTVIHNNAAEADAAATALFVAGPKLWHATAKAMGIKYVMLVDADGIAHMNPAMAERIHFEAAKPPQVKLSDPL